MLPAAEALERLREGNARYVAEDPHQPTMTLEERCRELATAQHPVATILGCADSRVPAEIVFDQDPGDLFVVRVAGNIAGPSQIGSVEFAAVQFGVRLVVVLGHSDCGAVRATLQELEQPSDRLSPGLSSIVDLMRPVLEGMPRPEGGGGPDALRRAVRANVEGTVARLRAESDIIEGLEREDGLLIMGAKYAVETGRVEFFEVPRDGG